MGDPAEIKAKRVKKQKTDREDARLLLRLMRENNFPQIWVPGPENRDLRQLLRHRHRLVQRRTRFMNQLQALAMNEGYRWKKKLFSDLGRYTHRVAISNHRLISFADGKVTFRWRDSAHNNEQKLMTLALDEFLRRFLLHLLPEGFVRIRNFGFLANRKRASTLPLCFQLLGAAATPRTEPVTSRANNASDL